MIEPPDDAIAKLHPKAFENIVVKDLEWEHFAFIDKFPTCQHMLPVLAKTRYNSEITDSCCFKYEEREVVFSYSFPMLYGGDVTIRSMEADGI